LQKRTMGNTFVCHNPWMLKMLVFWGIYHNLSLEVQVHEIHRYYFVNSDCLRCHFPECISEYVDLKPGIFRIWCSTVEDTTVSWRTALSWRHIKWHNNRTHDQCLFGSNMYKYYVEHNASILCGIFLWGIPNYFIHDL
jgi:hypothetical protein